MTLPPDFEEVVLATNLASPTAVAWADDGRMFIAEKDGVVKVLNPNGAPEPTPLIDISDHVNSYGDRGLLGIAVDSDFTTNRYLYLLYTYEHDPLDQTGAKVSRLTRVTVLPDNTLANPAQPETTILGKSDTIPCPAPGEVEDCIGSDGRNHSIGAVRADADGTLWVSSGDAENLKDQTYDPRSYAGKIVHVDRDGNGLPGHPFCPPPDASADDLTRTCAKVYATGFRNPFRFALRSDGGPIVGDVGQSLREEIDVVLPGGNYGWPCFEGTTRNSMWSATLHCAAVYALSGSDAPIPPFVEYEQPGGAAVIMGPVWDSPAFPPEYAGDAFFGDYVTGAVRRLELAPPARAGEVEPFATGWAGVALEQSPDGELVSVDVGFTPPFIGSVTAIRYAPGNKTPVARAAASPRWGDVPLTVQFEGDASTDPDDDALSYEWDFGDGTPSSNEPNPEHVYAAPGNHIAWLTVDDGNGRAATAAIRVTPGNTPPTVTVNAPADGSTYRGGGNVTLAAAAADAEDGALTGAAVRWQVLLHHGSHVHSLAKFKGPVARFAAPTDHDADSYLEARVVARDSGDLERDASVTIRPETVRLRIDSQPPGAPVGYDGRPQVAPFETNAMIGFQTVISAAESFEQDGRTYRFDAWDRGGDRVRNLGVGDENLTFVARYVDAAAGDDAGDPPSWTGAPPVLVAPLPLVGGLPAPACARPTVIAPKRARVNARRMVTLALGLSCRGTALPGHRLTVYRVSRGRKLIRVRQVTTRTTRRVVRVRIGASDAPKLRVDFAGGGGMHAARQAVRLLR